MESTPAAAAWGLERLGLPALWQQGLTGAGVRIGHLDTGVDGTHPALRGRLAAYVEFDREGYPLEGALPADKNGHGTHIAATLCGGMVDGLCVGAAPEAVLCSAAVIEGGKNVVRVLAGLDWLLDCGVRVACVSLGLPGRFPLYEIILERLRLGGILVVAPVGNHGAGMSCAPANSPGVLAVGALDPRGRVAHFSGSQFFDRAEDPLKPDLVAPGVQIPSACPGGGLRMRSGTSMAAAHIAGVAALLFQACPSAAPGQVAEALLITCAPLEGYGENRRGCGLVQPVQALAALQKMGGGQPA